MTIMTPTADAAAYAASGADARVEFIPGRAGSGLAYRIGLYGGGKGGEVEPSPQARAQFEHLLATFRLLDQPLRARAVRVPAASSVVDPLVAAAFGYPLRDADGVRYGVPEGYIENRTHMEHLGYAVRNLDQWRIKCFDVDWSRMLHAGEDWYRLDLANTAGAQVYAVADGVVVQHNQLVPLGSVHARYEMTKRYVQVPSNLQELDEPHLNYGSLLGLCQHR